GGAHPRHADAMVSRQALGLAEPVEREIDADDVVPALGEIDAVAALAAAEVEHAPALGRELGRLARQGRRLGAPDEAAGRLDVLVAPRAPGRPLDRFSAHSLSARPCPAIRGGSADRWRGLPPRPGSPPGADASTDRRCRESAPSRSTTR